MSANYDEGFFALLTYAGELADRCEAQDEDREQDIKLLRASASAIRLMTTEMLTESDLNPVEVCTERLKRIAAENGVSCTPSFSERVASGGAITWRELQLADAELDLACHPELAGLSWRERLCRHAIRFTAATGETLRMFSGSSTDEHSAKAVGDMLLLGVRLPHAAGDELSDDLIPRDSEELNIALRDDAFEL